MLGRFLGNRSISARPNDFGRRHTRQRVRGAKKIKVLLASTLPEVCVIQDYARHFGGTRAVLAGASSSPCATPASALPSTTVLTDHPNLAVTLTQRHRDLHLAAMHS